MGKDENKQRPETPVISPGRPDFLEPTPPDISETIQDNKRKADEPRINV